MKQIYMTMILFLNSLNLFAKPTDVVTNLEGPVGITINENEPYPIALQTQMNSQTCE